MCHCGCGAAVGTYKSDKVTPVRFLPGHHTRVSDQIKLAPEALPDFWDRREAGASYTALAQDAGVRAETMRERLQAYERKCADPGRQRTCACGAPAQGFGEDTCVACRMHPKCNCGKLAQPGAMYLGQRHCRRCGRRET